MELFTLLRSLSLALLLGDALASTSAQDAHISAKPGSRYTIPIWRMQSTTHDSASGDLKKLSQPGFDTSDWYTVSARSTVMAGLIENGVYNTTELFYSNNLESGMVDRSVFNSPWLYRHEFALESSTKETARRYFVQTHGITSKADVYFNGVKIADKVEQAGSYGGHKYDVTKHLKQKNCLLIQAYPTNYLKDYAMGFVDWNPYPPDNGTGVWRDVEVLTTGKVGLSPVRVVTDFKKPGQKEVEVQVKVDITNYADKSVNAKVEGEVKDPTGSSKGKVHKTVTLKPHEKKTVSLPIVLKKYEIWWPATWGSQPLYTASASATVGGQSSDTSPSRTFGIRHVRSHLNSHNATAFFINSHPFFVLGAGYGPDMFMRYTPATWRQQFTHVLSLGLNTLRLEGKQMHPAFYALADRMGLMILAGWECCDKWEGWTYNHDADGAPWSAADYRTAGASMAHEASLMQPHPSLLGFLVGSDFWPDKRATAIYVSALAAKDWGNPIIASAAKRGFPQQLGPSGMKMNGPYDWVPPNYWYGERLGAGFGFGSELGAGVGTPELGSLTRFLSASDLEDLWKRPEKGLYHMSTNVSSFHTRKIYNKGIWARFGAPRSLADYLWKAQVADYEATRAQFEGFAVRKRDERPATGLVYWMLNAAWPSLHWQLFDYFGKGAGAFYGVKTATRAEHVVYDYEAKRVGVVSHSLGSGGVRTVVAELFDKSGKVLAEKKAEIKVKPNSTASVMAVPGLKKVEDVAFLRLLLKEGNQVRSRNVYWLPKHGGVDELAWGRSSWYSTPVDKYVDLKALFKLPKTKVEASARSMNKSRNGSAKGARKVVLKAKDKPAFFVRLVLKTSGGAEVDGVQWSDNYVSLMPGEELELEMTVGSSSDKRAGMVVEIEGVNVEKQEVQL